MPAPRIPPRGWKRNLAIVAACALALRAALPCALESAVERQGRAALGVPLRVDDIDLALVRGGLGIEGLRIGSKHEPPDAAEIDPSTALLALERGWLRIGWLDLLRGRIHLRELELDAPRIALAREADGRIAPLPERAAELEQPPEEPSGGMLPLAVDRLALRSARVELRSADDPARELLAFGIDELSLADLALDADGFSLGTLDLRRPAVRLQRELAFQESGARKGAGRSAEAQRTPPVGAAPPPEPPPSAGPPPAYRVEQIAIDRAAFTLVTGNADLDMALAFSAQGVTAQRGQTFPARLVLEVARGTLEVDGAVGIDPPRFDGSLRWTGLDVPLLLAALPEGSERWIEAATASGELEVGLVGARSDGAAPELRASGTLALADVAAARPSPDVSLGWKALDVEIAELVVPLATGSSAPVAALRSLRWIDPSVRVTLPARESGPAEPAQEPPDVSAGPPVPSPQLSLGTLEVAGGRVEILDPSVSPTYRATLSRLSVAAQGLRWPKGDLRELRARFSGPAQATLELKGDLRGRAGEIQLTLRRLALPGFNPYAKSLAGLEISRGTFSLDTRARADGKSVELVNDLRVRHLSLATGGSGLLPGIGLPIDTALALLRDPKGNIALRVPLRVDEQGARTGFRAVLTAALRQALVGALSAPLKVLGRVADVAGLGGDEPVTALACVPGSAELAGDAAQQLDTIADLLADRPSLALVLRGRAGGADSAPVAEQVLRQAVEAGKAPDLPGSTYFQRRRLRQALEARAQGKPDELDPEDRAALERWIASTPVPPERLQSLAAMRAELLLENLASLAGVPRERLSLADPLEGAPGVALELGALSAGS